MTSAIRTSLTGRRIVVTRSRAQAAELGNRLEALGAVVTYCPAIRLAAPADARPLQQAAADLDRFDWIVLTSVNGVEALVDALAHIGGGLSGRFACVGPATAEALRLHGASVQAMPADFVGANIADVLADRIRAGERRVLLVRGAGGDARLPQRLRELNAEVTEVEAYRSVPDLANLEGVRGQLQERAVDVITFTSPSTATYFLEGVGALPPGIVLAAIGPVTAQRLQELGQRADVVASEHTIRGLVEALLSYFGDPHGQGGSR